MAFALAFCADVSLAIDQILFVVARLDRIEITRQMLLLQLLEPGRGKRLYCTHGCVCIADK